MAFAAVRGSSRDAANYITWDGGAWGSGAKARIETNQAIFVGLMIGGQRGQGNEHHINIQNVECYDIGDGTFYSSRRAKPGSPSAPRTW